MEQTLKNVFDRQKEAFIAEGDPSLDLRMDRIDRAINLLRTNGRAICEAIQSDFGCRSIGMSMGADIVTSTRVWQNLVLTHPFGGNQKGSSE